MPRPPYIIHYYGFKPRKSDIFWLSFKDKYDYESVRLRLLEKLGAYSPDVMKYYLLVEVQLDRYVAWAEIKHQVDEALSDLFEH